MSYSILKNYIFLLLTLSIVSNAHSQKIDFNKNIVHLKDSGNFHKLIGLFKGKPNPLIDSTAIAINRYIKSVSNYTGKTIQSIQIEQRHFGYDVNKPLGDKQNNFIHLADQLHDKTNLNTIRKNIFFKVKDTLNPLIIAYNEKWLRDIGYLQDARILAYPNIEDSNKVDIFIITKDIFPIGLLLNYKGPKAFETKINTENLQDKGNAISISQNYDYARDKKLGWGLDYIGRNIMGSFMDIQAGAQSHAPNYANGMASATNIYVQGNKPLLHPLDKWTGGFNFQNTLNNKSYPIWNDSLYQSTLNYQLKLWDAYAGFQLLSRKIYYNIDHPRYLLQFRYLNKFFLERPSNYLNQIDKDYQNIEAYFTSLTIFKQKIIRTQYLYGFGRNEDLPTGKSIVITAGHYKREGQAIPYLGFQFSKYRLLKNEHYRLIKINAGSSYFENQLQDCRFLASIEQISKIHYLESGYRYRHMIHLSFAETLKNKFNEALLINSIYGIPQLHKERIRGGTRIAANWESIWYNSRTFLGFKKAPFVFANLTYIRTVGDPIKNGDIYSAMGGGIRVRNENLILGTIELKGYYFPRTNLQLSPWNLSLITNIRFKYSSSITEKPDFVTIN